MRARSVACPGTPWKLLGIGWTGSDVPDRRARSGSQLPLGLD